MARFLVRYVLFTFVLIQGNFSFANTQENIEVQDSLQAANYLNQAKSLLYQKPDSSIYFASISLKYFNTIHDVGLIADASNMIGTAYAVSDNLDSAKLYFQKVLHLYSSTTDTIGMGNANHNLGIVFRHKGEFPTALKYFLTGLKYREYTRDERKLSESLSSIGLLQNQMKNYEASEVTLNRALKLSLELQDTVGIGRSYNNLGFLFLGMKNFEDANEALTKAFEYFSNINEQRGVYMVLGNLAVVNKKLGKYEQALNYARQSLEIDALLKDKMAMGISYGMIGQIQLLMGNINGAVSNCEKGYQLGKQIGVLETIRGCSECLTEYYTKKAASENDLRIRKESNIRALYYLKEFVAVSDSLVNSSKIKEVEKLTSKFILERKKRNEEVQQLTQDQQLKAATLRRDSLQYTGIVVLVLIMLSITLAAGLLSLNEKTASAFAFLTFLLLFEFLLVLLEPFIELISLDQPIYKLLFNSLLAIVIFPLHNYFQRSIVKSVSH